MATMADKQDREASDERIGRNGNKYEQEVDSRTSVELEQDRGSLDQDDNVNDDELEPELMRLHERDDSLHLTQTSAAQEPLLSDEEDGRTVGHPSEDATEKNEEGTSEQPQHFDQSTDSQPRTDGFEETRSASGNDDTGDTGTTDEMAGEEEEGQGEGLSASKTPILESIMEATLDDAGVRDGEEFGDDLEAQNDDDDDDDDDRSRADVEERNCDDDGLNDADDAIADTDDIIRESEMEDEPQDKEEGLNDENLVGDLNPEAECLEESSLPTATADDDATADEIAADTATTDNNVETEDATAVDTTETDPAAAAESAAAADGETATAAAATPQELSAGELDIDQKAVSRRSSRSRLSRRSRRSQGSDDRVVESGEGEEMEEESVRPGREELLERYQQALVERHELQQHNGSLQHRLSDCLRRKKVDDHQADDRSNIEQEQRYLKYMAALDDLRREERESSEAYHERLEDMENVCALKRNEVERQGSSLAEMIREMALSTPSATTGRTLPPKMLEGLLETCERREREVEKVRLINIKLKNQLDKHMSDLRSKEELAEGLHMIDFEQLKIENQTYNEKIEERTEELMRLKKKITTTVEVLSHVREKLQFVESESVRARERLELLEQQTAAKRDEVSHVKRTRDTLRVDNVKLRQAAGLLTNHTLLADYEQKVDECNSMTRQLQYLQRRRQEISRVLSVNTRVRGK